MKSAAKSNSTKATLLGIITTILMAITAIDFEKFDLNKPSDLWTLVLILIPTIGGAVSSIATKEQRRTKSSLITTILGLLTSIATAWQTIDFGAFDLQDRNNWAKLIVLSLPAISGYLSTINNSNEPL